MIPQLDGPGRRWELKPADPAAVRAIQAELGLPRLVARTLVARGVDTPDEAKRFLAPSLSQSWCDPADIPGLSAVADEVERSLDAHERIAVFGDFDVDGITSTAVLVRALRELGGDAIPFLPTREGEGYGLSQASLTRLLEQSPALVVTVDNGIAAKDEAAWLVRQGVRLAVTDHHEPSDLVPQGVPVADPKLLVESPSRELAGVGVALKLVCELGRRRGAPDLWREYTDFACLGTVADLMLFTEENRALVADGIARINRSPRPCIAALSALAGVDTAAITSESLSFSLIPRINAAGRIDDPMIALDLLLTDDYEAATSAAGRLDEINTRRRAIESELADEAGAQAREIYHGQRALVLAGEGWHEGVKGVVASRMVGRYGVPTLLFTINDGLARGSGRTVGSINLFQAVSRCSDLFERFGGHEAAVGITMPAGNLPEFTRRFTQLMDEEPAEAFVNIAQVDAAISLDEVSYEAFEAVQLLQPFGQGMRTPLFVAPDVFLENCGTVGKEGNHLRFNATDGVSSAQAIRFRCGNIPELLECDSAVDLVFEGQAEEWRGRHQAKLLVRDINIHCDGQEPIPDVVEELMARSDEFLVREPYAGIDEAESFHTKVVGVTFEGRQDLVRRLAPGDELLIERDELNQYDSNAIAVVSEHGQVGFLNRDMAAQLAPAMDGGARYSAVVTEVTGGEPLDELERALAAAEGQRSLGLNILVTKDSRGSDDEGELAHMAELRAKWAGVPADELDDRLREALVGDSPLHLAQQQALAHLAGGRSTLVVMATGRGKSLIFHLHAARTAIATGKASVFVYPLRALVSDQLAALERVFSRFGLVVRLLTGETDEAGRAQVFSQLTRGEVSVVLTTPEFLAIHAAEFAACGSIGFLAVDEAHHIGQAKTGHRPAYRQLPEVRRLLGDPVCLAATATADAAACADIDEVLGVVSHVFDPTVRENLELDDARADRADRQRDLKLANIVATGQKTVAYVNSRDGAVRLARMLRKRLPDLAAHVAYYHGGLPKEMRAAVERAFREGEVTALMATSAFGEGVNIPDIRHVVLYHLPFNDVEFNQMSGRGGRDGGPTQIHLLYSKGDVRINNRILASQAPERSEMAVLYKVIRRLAGEGRLATVEADLAGGLHVVRTADEGKAPTREEIVAECVRENPSSQIDEGGVSTGLAVFSELGLVRLVGRGSARKIVFVQGPDRVDLASSTRYQEGCNEIEEFGQFSDWAFEAPADDVLARINRPILPH